MLNLENLIFKEIDQEHINSVLQERQTLVEKAINQNDVELLEKLKETDKKNKQWLLEQKDRLGIQISRHTKIKQYLRSN